jgi:hypothetical protein
MNWIGIAAGIIVLVAGALGIIALGAKVWDYVGDIIRYRRSH